MKVVEELCCAVNSDKLYEWHHALELSLHLLPKEVRTELARHKLEDLDDEIYRAYLDAIRQECA